MDAPLGSFPLMRTGNVEEVRASFARIYGRPTIELVGRERALNAVVNHCRLRHIELNYGSYSANVRLQFPESRFVSQIFPIAGGAEVAIAGQSVAIDPRHSVCVSAGTHVTIGSNAAYQRLILCINETSLANHFAAMTGIPIQAPLKVRPAQDSHGLAARQLWADFLFLANQLNAAASLSPALLAEFEQALMTTFLYANRHNYSDLLTQKPADLSSRQVRLAEEYIEANCAGPIDAADLAVATGAGIRNLVCAFRGRRGFSPWDFLGRIRRERARKLQ